MSKRPHTAADLLDTSTSPTKVYGNTTYASLGNSDVHALLDQQVSSLSRPWKGSIPFKVYPIMDKATVTEEIFDAPPQEVDICDYINGQKRPMHRLYFCPVTYPPPKSPDEMINKQKRSEVYKGWLDLKRDLEVSAFEQGNPIVSNGSNSNKVGNRVFKCATLFRSTYNTRAMDVTADNPYRDTSLVWNRKNNRRDGIYGPKRKKTSKRSRDECEALANIFMDVEGGIEVGGRDTQKKTKCCPHTFAVKWDTFAFYVELERRSGNEEHIGHPQIKAKGLAPYPTRLLSQDEVDDTKHVIEATTNKAAGRNFIKTKFGKFVSSIKLAYLKKRDDIDKGNNTAPDDISRMLDDFEKSDEVAFTAISDVPVTDFNDSDDVDNLGRETITVSTKKNALGEVTNEDHRTVPSLKEIETHDYETLYLQMLVKLGCWMPCKSGVFLPYRMTQFQ